MSEIVTFPGKPDDNEIHEDILELGLSEGEMEALKAQARANRERRGTGYHGYSPSEAAARLAATHSRPVLRVIDSASTAEAEPASDDEIARAETLALIEDKNRTKFPAKWAAHDKEMTERRAVIEANAAFREKVAENLQAEGFFRYDPADAASSALFDRILDNIVYAAANGTKPQPTGPAEAAPVRRLQIVRDAEL